MGNRRDDPWAAMADDEARLRCGGVLVAPWHTDPHALTQTAAEALRRMTAPYITGGADSGGVLSADPAPDGNVDVTPVATHTSRYGTTHLGLRRGCLFCDEDVAAPSDFHAPGAIPIPEAAREAVLKLIHAERPVLPPGSEMVLPKDQAYEFDHVTTHAPERHVYRCSKGHVWEVTENPHQPWPLGSYVITDPDDPGPVPFVGCLRCLKDVLGKVERAE